MEASVELFPASRACLSRSRLDIALPMRSPLRRVYLYAIANRLSRCSAVYCHTAARSSSASWARTRLRFDGISDRLFEEHVLAGLTLGRLKPLVGQLGDLPAALLFFEDRELG